MNRRDFMKTTAVATAGLTVAGVPIRVRPAEEPIPDEYREYDYYSVRRLSVDHYPYIQHIEGCRQSHASHAGAAGHAIMDGSHSQGCPD